MKKNIFLAGILMPILGYTQQTDSTAKPVLLTTAPRLGGVNITNQVTPINAGGNTFVMQLPTADVGIPVYKHFSGKHPVMVKTGVRYQGLLLTDEQSIGSNNFHSLTVPLLVSYSFSRATNMQFIGAATAGTDGKQDIKGEDIQYVIGVRMGFHQRSAFKYGVTLSYISNYSGSYILPIPDLDWEINKRWSLSGIIPVRTSLKYAITKAHSLGITAGYNGGLYGLNNQPQRQYIQLQQYSGGLIYDGKLGQRWRVNLVAGYTFMQRLETFNMDQKISFNDLTKLNDRKPNISYRQNSFIFQGGISYLF